MVQDIRDKLVAATEEFKKASETVQGPQSARADTYAERTARQGTDPSRTIKDIPSYFDMQKRKGTQRPTSTQTDGMLERVYVQDWLKEPVGAVKRALRTAIGGWIRQNEMGDVDATTAEVYPDIDAVRHVNQFGTPEVALMEVTCTGDKKEQVIKFFQASNIAVWPETTNPLMAPDIAMGDTSQLAARRHHEHTIRVINSWWKAANYI